MKFPVAEPAHGDARPSASRGDLDHDALDDPGNRAISFSPKIAYGLYEVTDAPDGQLGQGRRAC